MSRPYEYTVLDTTSDQIGGKDRATVGVEKMYGIKYRNSEGDWWVGKTIVDVLSNTRKYQKMFFANKRSAITQCDKLNELYNAAEYRVVEVAER